MSPAPTEKVPVWVGGKSKAALRRAAANDGWLGVPLDNKGIAEVMVQLFEIRREMGNYEQPFDAVLSPMELITQEFVDTLDPMGRYHSSVLPWTPSPWGRAPWVEEGEDHTQFEVKVRAMERFREMMTGFGLWE